MANAQDDKLDGEVNELLQSHFGLKDKEYFSGAKA
jgi:hypothetical protein